MPRYAPWDVQNGRVRSTKLVHRFIEMMDDKRSFHREMAFRSDRLGGDRVRYTTASAESVELSLVIAKVTSLRWMDLGLWNPTNIRARMLESVDVRT